MISLSAGSFYANSRQLYGVSAVYAVLIKSSAEINSRQLIGHNKDPDGNDVVTLIFALKCSLQETRG